MASILRKLPITAVLLCAVVLSALLYVYAATDDDLHGFPVCKHCLMDRNQHASSRMLVGYTDGAITALCSIHCLAIDLVLNIDKTPEFIKASDYNSTVLVDAEAVSWVLGGLKKGVMTERAKWAFSEKKEAEKFTGQYGGEIVSFEQALEAAYQDMYMDSKVIRNKRKLKMMIRELEKRPLPNMRYPCCR